MKAEILTLSRMDAALYGRVAMLARVGFFDNANFNTGREGDEADRRAEKDRRDIDNLVALSAALNRGENIESFDFGSSEDAESFDPDDLLY